MLSVDTLWHEARGAWRFLARSPGFTATAVATLAICLGANLTIFAVVDAVLVRALPFPEPDRLVTIFNAYPGAGVNRSSASLPNYFDRRHAIKAFTSLSLIQDSSAIVGEAGHPETVQCARVSPEFFATLGVPLAMGRTFTEDELRYGPDQVAILTNEYWRNHFAADPKILGRTFISDGLTQTIIGVLPPHFHYLASKAEFFRPAASDLDARKPSNRHSNNYTMIARLAPGVTLEQAQAQIDQFNAVLLATDPYKDLIKGAGFHTTVASLHGDFVSSAKTIILFIQAGGIAVLVIGCVNLMNLLLVRASARSKELAVRQALGAGRAALARAALAETGLLSLAGALLGIGVGAAGIGLLRSLAIDRLPRGTDVGMDGRMVAAALMVAVLVALGLALPMIILTIRGDLTRILQTESRSGTTSRSVNLLRRIFIVVQITLALVVLSAAGLLGLSLENAMKTHAGFQTDNVLTADLGLPWKNYQNGASRMAFVRRLLPAIQALPGVSQVGIASALPFNGGNNDSAVTVDRSVASPVNKVRAHFLNAVGGSYFTAMQIPLLRGRLLADRDEESKTQVCVVDRAFAERYWPGQNPLGHRLTPDVTLTDKNAWTIVGVVAEIKQNELADSLDHGEVYFPYSSQANSYFSVVVRCSVPTAAVAPMLRTAVLKLDPELPLNHVRPMQSHIDDSLVARRSPAVMASIFALTALLLAAIGTYGLLSYSVTQRWREIGIRMALGAQPSQIRAQFLFMGVRVLVIGSALGLVLAWWTGHLMQSLLFNVPTLPVGILSTSLAVMTVATLLASLIPAGRTVRVNPVVALRAE
ncbi:MAG TPA: ABC transporter permease [Opitutaceae bacterium]|jgi:predicted permease